MAKCPSCQQKITKADRQSGKCPQCGAVLPEILETATPPFDPSAGLTQAPLPGEIPGGKPDLRPESTRPLAPPAAPAKDTRPTEASRDLGTASPPLGGTASPPVPPPAAAGSDTTDIGTAVPPPPAPEEGDKDFDPNRTVNPRTDAEKTLIDQALTAAPDDTAFAATLNASVTTPLDKPGATLAEGQPPSKSTRKKTGTALEDSLVIQPRDVHRGPGEVAAPCDYDVSKLIGEGGMGMVYQARQASLDREVALKMIKPRELDDSARARYTANELARVEQTLQRRDREWFLSEAMVTANLEHPYIVPVYDVIKDQKNSLFYAMKWVRGTPWNKMLRDKGEAENLEILMKVADAVAFAHDKGIIHRDLKPENVMVGAHGEVYVMDWGAALVTPDFERSTSLTQSSSGFGSPLYAAPELFLGTVEQIGVRSDVYLLGAVLFEVITGNPPHPYPSSRSEVLSILRSNEIRHTDYKGELLDIAKKAMATNQADRYPNVQEFQVAIREYQQHANSRTLSKRARANLVKAEQTGDYTDYQRAVFAYDEAFELWHGNEDARDGVGQAKLAYAGAALKKGDFDLGLEVADGKIPAHRDVIVKLRKAQDDRESQKKRLKAQRRIVAALAAMIVIGLTVATIWINNERAAAVTAQKKENEAKIAAQKSEQKAIDAAKEEEKAKIAAQDSEKKAIDAAKEEEKAKIAALESEKKAKKAAEDEVVARMDADKNAMEAVKQQKIAEANEKKAVAAKAAQEYEAYVAEIGLADSKIKTSAFEDVLNILSEIRTNEQKRKDQAAGEELVSFHGWEFNRLDYLSGQAEVLFSPKADAAGALNLRVDALALDREGRRYVVGRRDGTALVGSTGSDHDAVMELKSGLPIFAVAISPNGKLIATAGEPGAEGGVQLWSPDGKQIGKPFAGDRKAVFSVQFAERGGQTWLLTAGANHSAQLWQIPDGGQDPVRLGAPLRGHYEPVRQAVFSPEATQIVTVGDDSFAVVWDLASTSGEPKYTSTRKPFMLHNGPILAAAFSSDGANVVTADEDGQMYVWSPARLARIQEGSNELKDLVKNKQLTADRGKGAVVNDNLALHDKAVHAVAFSPDGKFVVSASDDHTVRFQRLRKPGEQARAEDVTTFRGHGGNVRGCAIASAGPGQPANDADRKPSNNWFVVSAGHDAKVMRWNVMSYKEEQVFHDPILAGTTGLDRDVLSAVFSPDGQTVLTGGRDHRAYQWDVRTGQQRELNFTPSARIVEEGHALPIWTAAYAPDAKWLLTASMDDRSLLWNTATGTQFGRLDRTGVPAVIAVSPDGSWVATSSSSGARGTTGSVAPKIQFWNVSNLKAGETAAPTARSAVRSIEQQGRLTALAFAPGRGLRLFSGFECRNPDEVSGGGLVWELKQDAGRPKWDVVDEVRADTHINAAAFRSAHNLLLTAREDGTVLQYDLDKKGSQPAVVASLGETAPMRLMALHPDGNSFVTVSPMPVVKNVDESAVMHKWSVDAARSLKSVRIDSSNVFSLSLAEQGDEALIVGAAPKGQPGTVVRKYNLETGAVVGRDPFLASGNDVRQFWGAVYAPAAVAPPGERAVLALHGTRAELYDGAARPVSRSSPHGQVRAVSYSSDGKFMLTAGADGTIKLWDAAKRTALCQILDPHRGGVQSAAFSPAPNSYQLVSAGQDKVVKLWNWDGTSKAPQLARSFAHDETVRSVAFSPGGDRIVCGCDDGIAWVWKSDDDKQPLGKTPKFDAANRDEGGHQGPVLTVAFSRTNADWIVTGGEDNLAKVWSVGNGIKLHSVLKGHAAAVRCAAFSPDDRRIVTGSGDTFAKLWDPRLSVAAGGNVGKDVYARELLTLSRHDRAVTSVAFSPGGGDTVLTASSDGDTVLWLSKPAQAGK